MISKIPRALDAIFSKDENQFFSTFDEKIITYLDPSGRSILINAIIENLPKIASFLLKYDELLEMGDKKGLKPLHYCAMYDNTVIAQMLVDKGVDIDSIDNFGNTPLWKATFEADGGISEIIDFLVNRGANIHLENNYGVSPIGFAKETGNYNLVKKLKSY